ncbi:carbon storage regulator CsrA [bacterium]|nr:carbon storage regulator CsrA [bacterium]
MLVLTRRRGEWIAVGEDVRIRVLSVKGDQVQLGVDAPRAVPVHRGEIFEQIHAATEDARRSAVDLGPLRGLVPQKKAEPGK